MYKSKTAEINKLKRELYWMRERWEYQEGIQSFMEDYLQKERQLARLVGVEPIVNWSKEGF
jgi:nucleoside-diphosphate-sugar epimerase